MLLSEYLKQQSKPKLENIIEKFWNEDFILPSCSCPYCEQQSDMLIQITEKSVKLVCNNKDCQKVYFWRNRVNLGAIEK